MFNIAKDTGRVKTSDTDITIQKGGKGI